MSRIKSLMAALVLAVAGTAANADAFTEEYKGSQQVDRGRSYTFDFDMWYENDGLVNDTAPGLSLTSDAEGAFGNWSSATLYIDFHSTDSQSESASIDLDAWGFRFLGFPLWDTDLLTLGSLNISRPSAGSAYYYYTYTLSAAQIAAFDEYGWGSLQIGATNNSGNDFDITRVAFRVTTGAVSEPGMLALLAGGLLGLGFAARRRMR